jgi:hypothetical protein
MKSGIAARARRYVDDAVRAFDRAPVEVAVAVFTAICFSYAVEAGGDAFPRWLELAITALLVICGAWSATMLHALGVFTTLQRWATTLFCAVAAAAYGQWLLDIELGGEAWRAAMLIAAAALWLLALPWLGRLPLLQRDDGSDDRVLRLRLVTGRILLRLIGALLYCAALFAGLALALGAVNALFELDLRGHIYAHVAGWIFFVLAPWIVIGGIADYARPPEEHNAVAGVVHRMSAFLVPPLLALYTVILYAYTLRIAITGEVPKNIVSPMVLAAGLLALAALLLFDPRPGTSAGARTLRAAPPLFVPLAALGAWTILMRVGQYGWTEFRLLRLLLLITLGILAAGAAWHVLRRRRLALHIGLFALAGVMLAAALGVPALARSSQQARLEHALARAGIPADGPVPSDTVVVDIDLFDDVNSSARYLVQHFGTGALPPVLATGATHEDSYNLAGMLGLRRAEPATPRAHHLMGMMEVETSIAVDGAVMHRIIAGPRRSAPGAGNARLDQATRSLRMTTSDGVFTADLKPLLAYFAATEREGALPAEQASLPALDEGGATRGRLLLLEIQLELPGDSLILHRVNGVLLLGR